MQIRETTASDLGPALALNNASLPELNPEMTLRAPVPPKEA